MYVVFECRNLIYLQSRVCRMAFGIHCTVKKLGEAVRRQDFLMTNTSVGLASSRQHNGVELNVLERCQDYIRVSLGTNSRAIRDKYQQNKSFSRREIKQCLFPNYVLSWQTRVREHTEIIKSEIILQLINLKIGFLIVKWSKVDTLK